MAAFGGHFVGSGIYLAYIVPRYVSCNSYIFPTLISWTLFKTYLVKNYRLALSDRRRGLGAVLQASGRGLVGHQLFFSNNFNIVSY